MTYILRVDSSPRYSASHSRRLADRLQHELVRYHAGAAVRVRDLARAPAPHLTHETVAGFYSAPEDLTPELSAATAASDALIAELKGAAALIISAPMYNFSAPSVLKAWIDQVVRLNATFAFDGSGFSGLVPVETAYLALSYGLTGYQPEQDAAGLNHLEPYLTSVLSFIGVRKVMAFYVEATSADAGLLAASEAQAERQIRAAFAATVAG